MADLGYTPNVSKDDLDILVSKGIVSPQAADSFSAKYLTPAMPLASDPNLGTAAKIADSVNPVQQIAQNQVQTTPEPIKLSPEALTGQAPSQVPSAIKSSPEAPKVDPSMIALKQPVNQASQQPPLLAGANDYMQNIQDAYGLQKQGIQHGAEAAAKQGQQTSAALQQVANDAQARQQEMQRATDMEQAKLDEQLNKYNQMSADLQKNAAIDPNRYWKNQSTGQKVVAAIALAFGGLGGAMSGKGGNAALDVINGAIQRDFEAQKNDADKRQAALGAQGNLVSMMRGSFSDRRAADAAALANMYNLAQLKVQQFATQASSAQAKAEAEKLSGALKQAENQQMMEFKMRIQQVNALSQASGGGGIANPTFLPEEYRKTAVKMPNGLYRLASSEKGAQELNEKQQAADNIRGLIHEARQLQEGGMTIPGSDRAAVAEALKTRMVLSLERLGGLTQPNRAVVEELSSSIAKAGTIRGDRFNMMMDTLTKEVDQNLNSSYRQHIPGWQPVKAAQ